MGCCSSHDKFMTAHDKYQLAELMKEENKYISEDITSRAEHENISREAVVGYPILKSANSKVETLYAKIVPSECFDSLKMLVTKLYECYENYDVEKFNHVEDRLNQFLEKLPTATILNKLKGK
jgi:hypothetical protein